MKKDRALKRAQVRLKISAPGTPVFGSVARQASGYRRRETGALVNDLLRNHQQSSHATVEDRARGSTLDIVSQPWKSPRQTWGRWGMHVGDRVGAYSVTGLTGLQTMLR